MNRTFAIALSVALAIFVAAYFLSPFLAVRDLIAAAKGGDRDQLAELVDFPAVRESLKDQLNAKLLKSINGSSGNGLAEGLAVLLGPMMVDKLVDAYVTPDAIGAMVRTGHTPKTGSNQSEPRYTRWKYKGMNLFAEDLSSDPDFKSYATLVFARRGLVTWQLIRIEVPEFEQERSHPAARNSDLAQRRPLSPPITKPHVSRPLLRHKQSPRAPYRELALSPVRAPSVDAPPEMLITPAKAVGRTHDCTSYYPDLSRRLNEGGDVLVHYDVSADGSINNVGILKSSGSERLDNAAISCISTKWRDVPAMQGATPVASADHQAIVHFGL